MSTDVSAPAVTVAIELSRLSIGPNVRPFIEDDQYRELVASVRTHGVLQSLLVRPCPDDAQRFEVVAGQRRFHAACETKLATVPVVIRSLTDAEIVEVQLVENGRRADMHPLDEAEAVAKLVAFYKEGGSDAAAAIARAMEQLTVSRSRVYDLLSLEKLTAESKAAFRDNQISLSDAIELARIDADHQAATIKELVDSAMSHRRAVRYMRERSMSEQTRRDQWRKAVAEAQAKNIPVLTSKEAKKLYPKSWDWQPATASGYVDMDDYCAGTKKKYQQLLGKANVPLHLVSRRLEPRYVVKIEDIAPILKKLKIEPPVVAKEAAPAAEDPQALAAYQKRQAEAERQARITERADDLLQERALAAVTAKNAHRLITAFLQAYCADTGVPCKAKPSEIDLGQAILAVDLNLNGSLSEAYLDVLKLDRAAVRKEAAKQLAAAEKQAAGAPLVLQDMDRAEQAAADAVHGKTKKKGAKKAK